MGWRGSLAHDGGGAPVNVLWSAVLTVTTAQPSSWIDVTSPRCELFEDVLATFLLSKTARSRRNFTIAAIPPERVVLPVTRFTLDAGEQGFTFLYSARDPGAFRIRVTEALQPPVTSVGCLAVERAFDFELSSSLTGGGTPIPAGAPGGLPPPPDYGDWKDCKPAQGPTPGTIKIVCGNCTTGTPTANCPSVVYEMQPAYCFFSLFDECYMTTNASITSPAFSFQSSSIVACGSIGGSISGKIKGVISIGVSASRTLHKLCCTYKLDPALPPATVSWPDCL